MNSRTVVIMTLKYRDVNVKYWQLKNLAVKVKKYIYILAILFSLLVFLDFFFSCLKFQMCHIYKIRNYVTSYLGYDRCVAGRTSLLSEIVSWRVENSFMEQL